MDIARDRQNHLIDSLRSLFDKDSFSRRVDKLYTIPQS